jgi:hypothetical protein
MVPFTTKSAVRRVGALFDDTVVLPEMVTARFSAGTPRQNRRVAVHVVSTIVWPSTEVMV